MGVAKLFALHLLRPGILKLFQAFTKPTGKGFLRILVSGHFYCSLCIQQPQKNAEIPAFIF